MDKVQPKNIFIQTNGFTYLACLSVILVPVFAVLN